MKLADYLGLRLSDSTVKIYVYEINRFIKFMGEPQAKKADYKTMVTYLKHLRREYENASTIDRILVTLKHYFFYLIEQGERRSHPCRYLKIADGGRKNIQLQDLLNEKELTNLLSRSNYYPDLKTRNEVVMSLLVYQGLRLKELVNLRLDDVDLVRGNLHIRGENKRGLKFKPEQILLFADYLNSGRVNLLKSSSKHLIITGRGTAERGRGIHYLVGTYQREYPEKKITATRIRQSVIANLLKRGIDLRVVQVFAGHRSISSTERYRENNLEGLKRSINKYHPLK